MAANHQLIYQAMSLNPPDHRSSFDSHYAYHDQREFEAYVMLGSTMRPGIRIADMACGTGISTLAIARSMHPTSSIFGVDILLLFVQQARAKLLQHLPNITSTFSRADVSSQASLAAAFGNQLFDVIICSWASQEINNFPAVMRMWAAQFLAPNGFMVVDLKHPNNNIGTVDIWRGPPTPLHLSEALPNWLPSAPFSPGLPARLHLAQPRTHAECCNAAVALGQASGLMVEMFPINPCSPSAHNPVVPFAQQFAPYTQVSQEFVTNTALTYAATNQSWYDENMAMTAWWQSEHGRLRTLGFQSNTTSLKAMHKVASVVARYRNPGPVVDGKCPICKDKLFAQCHQKFNKPKDLPGEEPHSLLSPGSGSTTRFGFPK